MKCKYCDCEGPNFYHKFHTDDCCYECYANRHNTKVFIGVGLVVIILGAGLWGAINTFPPAPAPKVSYRIIKIGEVKKVEFIPSVFSKQTAIHFTDGQVIMMPTHIQIPHKYIKIRVKKGRWSYDPYYWEIIKHKRPNENTN